VTSVGYVPGMFWQETAVCSGHKIDSWIESLKVCF